MLFMILSREGAERISGSLEATHILISITDYGSPPADIKRNKNRKGLLRVQFDDVDNAMPGNYMITDKQAAAIARFVDEKADLINLIVVHCEAGISRSSGTAAAIAFFYDQPTYHAIFKDRQFVPNMTVFRKIMAAMLERRPDA